MSNKILQSILIFAVCIVLAVYFGYIVASPLGWKALFSYGIVLAVFAFPFLLKWHHPLMILSWNMNAIVFLLPGDPPLWLFMVAISLMFSVTEYALSKRHNLLVVRQIIYPLLALAIIVIITAHLRGGIGLGSLGGDTGGGKRYIFLFGAILGYMALTFQPIPTDRASLYLGAFFIGGASAVIGNLLPLVNPAFYIIFAIFPPEESGFEAIGLVGQSEVTRFGGLTMACNAIFCVLLARYGIRGVLDLSSPLRWLPLKVKGGLEITKPWRLLLFLAVLVLSLLGGFRSTVVIFSITFFLLFYFENLFRNRLFPILLLCAILIGSIFLPIANKLPLSIQRAISVLPVKVDPVARMSALGSTEWRLEMWRRLLPQVPEYLLLGKGYSLNTREMALIYDPTGRTTYDSMEVAILAGDYHNGPLSVIIPFGIFGVICFIWFIIAALHVLWKNYRFSDPTLLTINRFLFVMFLARTIYFLFVFGSLYSDFVYFTGLVGLSVALNHGARSGRFRAVTGNTHPAA